MAQVQERTPKDHYGSLGLYSSISIRPKRTSSLWVRDNPRWSRVNNLSVKQQVRIVRTTDIITDTVSFLKRNAPLDDEVAVIQELLQSTLLPAYLLSNNGGVMIHANAVHWAKATSWHRIICALEDDLQQVAPSAKQVLRALLYDKLEVLRAVFYESLRVAERHFLLLKRIDKTSVLDKLAEVDGEAMQGAQRMIFEHAMGVVRLCGVVEEIDELGDDEATHEAEYQRLMGEYEGRVREVQLLEIPVRIESSKAREVRKRRSISLSSLF